MFTCLRAYMLACLHAYTLTRLHAYMLAYLHTLADLHICIHTFLHTYILTHLHTHILTYLHTIHILGFLGFYSNFLRRSVSVCHPFYLFFSPLGLSSVAGAHSVHSLWKQWDFVAQKLCSSRVQLINAVPINHPRSSHRWRVIWNHFHGNFLCTVNRHPLVRRWFARLIQGWRCRHVGHHGGWRASGLGLGQRALGSWWREQLPRRSRWEIWPHGCAWGDEDCWKRLLQKQPWSFFFWWLEPWFSMG